MTPIRISGTIYVAIRPRLVPWVKELPSPRAFCLLMHASPALLRCWARLRRKNSDRVIALRKLPSIRRSDRYKLLSLLIPSSTISDEEASESCNRVPALFVATPLTKLKLFTVANGELGGSLRLPSLPMLQTVITPSKKRLSQVDLIGTDQNISGETGRCWGERRVKYRLQLACGTNRVCPNVTNSPEAHQQQVPRTVNLDLRVRLWR